jgi:hypothetical protein
MQNERVALEAVCTESGFRRIKRERRWKLHWTHYLSTELSLKPSLLDRILAIQAESWEEEQSMSIPQGAEAHKFFGCFAARMKPCPFKTGLSPLAEARPLQLS